MHPGCEPLTSFTKEFFLPIDKLKFCTIDAPTIKVNYYLELQCITGECIYFKTVA